MYIVSNESNIQIFTEYKCAYDYAFIQSMKGKYINDDCISYTEFPRIVIHKVDVNTEYDLNFILSEECVVHIFNNH